MNILNWFMINLKKYNLIFLIFSAFEANALMNYFDSDHERVTFAMILPRANLKQKRIYYFRNETENNFPAHLLEQLFIYSGSLYFDNYHEQSNYLKFLGYCPSSRTKFEQNCFDDNLMEKNGYVQLQNRSKVFSNLPKNETSKFERDPQALIKKINFIQNFKNIPESAHHLKIFNEGQKPFD